MKPLFKLGRIGITPIHLAAVALVGYLVLKPKTASAAGATGPAKKPVTTTTGTLVAATLSLAPTIAGAIQNWFSTPSYVDKSPDVVAPEGWT